MWEGSRCRGCGRNVARKDARAGSTTEGALLAHPQAETEDLHLFQGHSETEGRRYLIKDSPNQTKKRKDIHTEIAIWMLKVLKGILLPGHGIRKEGRQKSKAFC